MKISRRTTIFIFIFLSLLFLVLLYWPQVMAEIIQPVSLVIWLLLRTFVLSIDQQYFWWALIIAAVFFTSRLFPRVRPSEETIESNSSNETLRSIKHWRTLFIPDENIQYHNKFLEREFIHLMVKMYAARLHVAPDFHLHESLRQGEIPIPENIRAYLFKEDTIPENRTLKTILRRIWNAPQTWRKRSKVVVKAEHDRIIEEILTFFETSLEIENDGRIPSSNEH